MISRDYKFMFVHIPKTGGTSIMKALRPYGLLGDGHHTLTEIKNNFKLSDFQVSEYFKFTVVRNPWDIVASNYHYSKMEKSYWHSSDGTTKWGIHPDYDTVSKIGFGEYVHLVVKNKLNHRFATTPQVHWIDGVIDYFIRFENLNSDFSKACDQIGLPKISLSKVNSSNHDHYSTYYDKTSEKLVAAYYKQDIERFDYSF
jgi:hypothetical protein